jgi:hypothetical protein
MPFMNVVNRSCMPLLSPNPHPTVNIREGMRLRYLNAATIREFVKPFVYERLSDDHS